MTTVSKSVIWVLKVKCNHLYIRAIVMTTSIPVIYLLIITSTQETVLKDFLEILKRTLLLRYCIHSDMQRTVFNNIRVRY